jgi:CO/xanthine dehydrogenase Mo-binding subunit
MQALIGEPVDRVDGQLKVTGQAKYAAEFRPARSLGHTVLVPARIGKGSVRSIGTAALSTRMLYAWENVSTTHRIVPVDTRQPTYMRAPGESTGVFALEVAGPGATSGRARQSTKACSSAAEWRPRPIRPTASPRRLRTRPQATPAAS